MWEGWAATSQCVCNINMNFKSRSQLPLGPDPKSNLRYDGQIWQETLTLWSVHGVATANVGLRLRPSPFDKFTSRTFVVSEPSLPTLPRKWVS